MEDTILDDSVKEGEETPSTLIEEESKLDSIGNSICLAESRPLFEENCISEFKVFLYTKYQQTLDSADQISKKLADETKPFEYKYQARAILESLMSKDVASFENNPIIREKINSLNVHEDSKVSEIAEETDQDLINLTIIKGQIYYILGINYFESEEYTESDKNLRVALQYLNTLPKNVKFLHINMIQDIYNNLGIIHCNRDNHKKGLPYFTKAEQIYNLVWSIKTPSGAINNSLKQFLRDCKTDIKFSHSNDTFQFYIDGGVDKTRVEKNYTLTLFYMAQVYTKLEKNEKAVTYCAQTVKRQLETKDYDVKDWATNWVNLAEYFIENNHFSQAEYCLFAGISILPLPNSSEEDQELRAMMQSQIGRYYLQRMKFGIDLFQKGVTIGTGGPLFDTVHKKFIDFPSLDLKWPQITDVSDIEQAKFLFRLANTQFKKAHEYFVLDGFVTEHSRLKKDVSELYKYITMMETNQARIYAMYERRRDMIEPIVDCINPEAFEAIWSELCVDLVNILHEMFDMKYEELKQCKKVPKKAQLDLLNQYGKSCIKHATAVANKLETLKEIEDRDSYIQAVINQRLAIGKIYSKLYDKDKKQILDYYSLAMDNYKILEAHMRDYRTRNDFTPTLEEQFRLCTEMIELLPVKMEKVRSNA